MVYISNSKRSGKNIISIEHWKPDIECHFYSALCPNENVISEYKRTNNEDIFIRDYLKQLCQLHPEQVSGDLQGRILICKEDYGVDICEIIKMWFKANHIRFEVV